MPTAPSWSRFIRSSLLVLLLSACVPRSIAPDVSTVRHLSQARALPALPEGNIDADTDSDARALLSQPLDAERAVRIALLNNRELRARLRELGIARGRLLQAGLVANPVFEAELLPERDSDVELRVEYELTSLLFAPLQKRAEAHELAAERYDVAAAVVQLAYEVRVAFFGLEAAEQRLRIARQSLDALAAGREAAVAMLEAGNVPPLEASTQIAAFERARITVAQIELEVVERRELMQRRLGLLGADTQWTLATTLEPVPEQPPELEELERRALEANLGLRASKERIEAVAKRIGVARAQGAVPELAVDVHSLPL